MSFEGFSMRFESRVGFGAAVCGIFLGVCLGVGYGAEARNTDLVRFLPNDGNSVFSAAGLLRKWPEGGPKELWRVEVGWGKTAVIEAGGRAFTGTQTDKKQWALCLHPLTGETLWKKLLVDSENRHFVQGPVTSPVVDGDRVYFIPMRSRAGTCGRCDARWCAFGRMGRSCGARMRGCGRRRRRCL